MQLSANKPQLIIRVSIPENDLLRWNEHRRMHPTDVFMVHNLEKSLLSTILDRGRFIGVATNGLPAGYGCVFRSSCPKAEILTLKYLAWEPAASMAFPASGCT
jgi:hypothetical protein